VWALSLAVAPAHTVHFSRNQRRAGGLNARVTVHPCGVPVAGCPRRASPLSIPTMATSCRSCPGRNCITCRSTISAIYEYVNAIPRVAGPASGVLHNDCT